MNTNNRCIRAASVWVSLGIIGILSGCADGGGALYGYAPDYEGPYAVIRADSDFYGPLSAYGRWVTVGSYGLCWIPNNIGPDWQPYEEGSWVATDGGWYWDSGEPWGWATCHYGRWIDDSQFGWCWIPGTDWAPAWVSWCADDDFIGWAPLPPEGAHFWSGFFGLRDRRAARRDYVFVRRRDFLDRVRPAAVIPNRAAVGARIAAGANLRFGSHGPAPSAVARASGHEVHPLPISAVRQRRQLAMVWNQRATDVRLYLRNGDERGRPGVAMESPRQSYPADNPRLTQPPPERRWAPRAARGPDRTVTGEGAATLRRGGPYEAVINHQVYDRNHAPAGVDEEGPLARPASQPQNSYGPRPPSARDSREADGRADARRQHGRYRREEQP